VKNVSEMTYLVLGGTYNFNTVTQMQPVATDGLAWSQWSVCWSRLSGALTWVGPRNHVSDWVHINQGEGAIFGFVQPIEKYHVSHSCSSRFLFDRLDMQLWWDTSSLLLFYVCFHFLLNWPLCLELRLVETGSDNGTFTDNWIMLLCW